MLKIRDAQMHALAAARDESRVSAIVDRLYLEHPGHVVGQERSLVRRRVASALRRARGFGLHDDRDLLAFAFLCIVISDVFDTHPPFQRLLADPTVPAGEKMTRLFQSATDADWQAAAALPPDHMPRETR
ncbi:hypothetical protein [Myxococcus sp. Y35]|uniref:hypothetical protein n=1 Tax=Pseudomyxococcus flavus TaxID=3115648 RepID=UPI003CEE95F7